MSKIILTGDRPTGKLHVGHYVGSLKRRVELQNSGEYDKIFIMIADAQALTDNADNPEKVRQNIIEVALDYLSVGLDPAKSDIFIQSQISQLTELTFYYMNLVTVSRLQRNPTVKSEIQMRNFEASIPVGFFCYPISQAADITAFKATTVPAGEDQEPMIEQTREIVRKFNSVYGDTLVEPQILLPDNKVCLRLPGTDGKAKMSKSLGNCIYLSDTEEDVKKNVRNYRIKQTFFVLGVMAVSVIIIVSLIVYYNIKQRALVGALYLSDENSAVQLVNNLMYLNINKYTLQAGSDAMLEAGYSAKGYTYLLRINGELVSYIVIALILAVILIYGLISCYKIGKKDYMGQIKLKVTNKTVINRCAKLYSNGFVVPVITGVRIMAYRLTDYTISNADTILKNIL